jgi:hypothetical protein
VHTDALDPLEGLRRQVGLAAVRAPDDRHALDQESRPTPAQTLGDPSDPRVLLAANVAGDGLAASGWPVRPRPPLNPGRPRGSRDDRHPGAALLFLEIADDSLQVVPERSGVSRRRISSMISSSRIARLP